MNIITFSMVLATYENPAVYGDTSGADWWTWLTLHLFADQKFMSIFSLLFGAGICIFMDRSQAKTQTPWRFQASRMMWLLVIGLIHAYFIWYGDILVTYAIAGMALATVRNWNPWKLLVSGFLVMAVIPTAISVLFYFSVPYWPEESLMQMKGELDLSSAANVAEIAAYTGPWAGQMMHRLSVAIVLQVFVLPITLFWHTAGLMMMGAAAYRWGILSATRSTRFYTLMIVVGLLIGLPLIGIGVWFKQQHGWDPVMLHFADGHWNYFGGVFVAMGWVGVVMLLCKRAWFPSVRKGLAAVGRMALTNYIGQSVICTFLFYGHGLGWFNTFERVELLYVVAGVWVFQIAFSLFWLRFFRFGPLEWIWRCATYVQRQPLWK